LNKNYSSFRIKKIAFTSQAKKNVDIRKDEIYIVKNNYKGNWEVYKNHKSLRNYTNENKIVELDLSKPVELAL